VVINAAAAIVASGVAANFREAAELAAVVLASGKAAAKLKAFAEFTNSG
jgi:anthranilate phosphoribosyltransferase